MTNQDIFRIAMKQSAADSSCSPEDFLSYENKVVLSEKNDNARNYLTLPFLCDLTSYGSNVVGSVSPELFEAVSKYIEKYSVEECFETPNIHALDKAIKPFNACTCFMAEYFLPDLDIFKIYKCGYETKLLHPQDIEKLYTPEWTNALCSEPRKHLDRLCVGAYDNGKLIGLAGCSADCESMWQVGIDVLPQYRKQGIAAAITSELTAEILKRGIVPFYCAAWSNIKSVRNAIKIGYRPAWVQLTIKSTDFIKKEFNQ